MRRRSRASSHTETHLRPVPSASSGRASDARRRRLHHSDSGSTLTVKIALHMIAQARGHTRSTTGVSMIVLLRPVHQESPAKVPPPPPRPVTHLCMRLTTNAHLPRRSASDHLAMAPCCSSPSACCCSSAASASSARQAVPGPTRHAVAAPSPAWPCLEALLFTPLTTRPHRIATLDSSIRAHSTERCFSS